LVLAVPDELLTTDNGWAFPAVAVTVDVVTLTIRGGEPHVLLVCRGTRPHRRRWALPGGFVREHEDLPEAAVRELTAKTGQALGRLHLEQLATYGGPGRDPRARVVSVAYLAFVPDLPEPVAGTGATDAAWVPVDSLDLPGAVAARRPGPLVQGPAAARRLAFDHARILVDGLERARSKLEYTPLATRFAGQEFTISELRAIYETVWGVPLHPGNFHRKVLSVQGFVVSTGYTTDRGGQRGGPRARLYRAGDATLLHPALLRPGRADVPRQEIGRGPAGAPRPGD
jgi:8-oxo-dGTP diphosphatase